MAKMATRSKSQTMGKSQSTVARKRRDSGFNSRTSLTGDKDFVLDFSVLSVDALSTSSQASILDSETQLPTVRFSYIEAVATCSVFEDTVDKLAVIGSLLPNPAKEDIISHMSLEERFLPDAERILIYPNEGPHPSETDLMRVQRIRGTIQTVLEDSIIDIESENKQFFRLLEANRAAEKTKEEEAALLEDLPFHLSKVKDVQAEIAEAKKVVFNASSEMKTVMQRLEGEMHDSKVQSEIERRYVKRYEETRVAQAQYKFDFREKELQTALHKTATESAEEERTNMEIETYINMTKQELEDDIEAWMERYDKELEEKDQDILKLRVDREVQMRTLTELQELFEKHRVEMDEYLALREARRIAKEKKDFLDKMATRIQAWWRGILCRRWLKKMRKKGKKGKGKDKGKGKKK